MDGDVLFTKFQKILKAAGVEGERQLDAARACCDLSIQFGQGFHQSIMREVERKPKRAASC